MTWGDGVVVVHKDNTHPIDLSYVVRIYYGFSKVWPDGSPAFSPRIVSPELEMRRLVSNIIDAIGFLRASQVDSSVRVVEK